MRLVPLVLLSFAFLLPPHEAAAQKKRGAAQTCPKRLEAKRAFDQGHLAYRSGEYEAAILKFQDSYSLCELPLTLLAIANAYDQAGDAAATLEYLEKYEPNANDKERAEIEERIKVLKDRRAEQEAEKRREEERKRKEEAERKAAEERRAKERAAEEIRREQEEEDRQTLELAGWATGGVGAAVLLASAVTGGLALSLDGDLASECTDGRCATDRSDDIDQLGALSTATDVMLVVGGVLAAGGLTMVLVAQPSDGSSTSVGLSIAPGGLSLKGSF